MDRSLDDEVTEIYNFYSDFNKMNESIVEMNTERWVKLGGLLNDHEKHVIAAGKNWVSWVTDRISFCGKRRRQQIMFVALVSADKIKPFYSMGIDKMYIFIKKLENYHKDLELIDILNEFKFSGKPKIDTDEDKKELNNSADQVIEYFKFKGNCSTLKYEKDLVIDVIKAGGQFTSGDYEEIERLSNKNESIDDYLINMLMTGTSPPSKNSKSTGNESIYVILAKLEQTIDEFILQNEIPLYLSKETVGKCHEKICWLMTKCNEV